MKKAKFKRAKKPSPTKPHSMTWSPRPGVGNCKRCGAETTGFRSTGRDLLWATEDREKPPCESLR